jgi:hypothetical protein
MKPKTVKLVEALSCRCATLPRVKAETKLLPSVQDWNVMWIDTSVSSERLMELKGYQKLNHFPGMHILARKVSLKVSNACVAANT